MTSETPITAVSAAVFRDGKVLLAQRASTHNTGLWTLPGGRQHFGETLEEAVRRELDEETGLRLLNPVICDAMDVILPDKSNPAAHFVIVVFACYAEGEVRLSEELSRSGWFGLEEAGGLAATPGLINVLQNAAEELKVRQR